MTLRRCCLIRDPSHRLVGTAWEGVVPGFSDQSRPAGFAGHNNAVSGPSGLKLLSGRLLARASLGGGFSDPALSIAGGFAVPP